MNVNVILNEEKNGIEIRFDGKPEAEVIESLKSNGFRWSGKQKMWFAKQTDERIQFANSLNGGEVVSSMAKNKTEKQAYDLWEMTRTEDIPNNFEIHKTIHRITQAKAKTVCLQFPEGLAVYKHLFYYHVLDMPVLSPILSNILLMLE